MAEDDGPDRAEPLPELLARGWRYALALTHDPARAGDVLQDACLAVVQARGPWKAGYLFAAVRSRFYNQERRAALVSIDPVGDAGEFVAGEAGDALGDGDRFGIDERELGAALAALPPAQREALYLAAVEGWSTAEIARRTDRPRGTILSLIHRARHRLRQALGGKKEAQA